MSGQPQNKTNRVGVAVNIFVVVVAVGAIAVWFYIINKVNKEPTISSTICKECATAKRNTTQEPKRLTDEPTEVDLKSIQESTQEKFQKFQSLMGSMDHTRSNEKTMMSLFKNIQVMMSLRQASQALISSPDPVSQKRGAIVLQLMNEVMDDLLKAAEANQGGENAAQHAPSTN